MWNENLADASLELSSLLFLEKLFLECSLMCFWLALQGFRCSKRERSMVKVFAAISKGKPLKWKRNGFLKFLLKWDCCKRKEIASNCPWLRRKANIFRSLISLWGLFIHLLPLSVWVKFSADDIEICFLFSPQKNRIWHFMQIVSGGDNLHEISNPFFFSNEDNLHEMSHPIFWEKYKKYHQFVIC